MITVELQLPTYSVAAFLGWMPALPPAIIAIILAADHYTITSLKVAAGLLGGLLIVSGGATILQGSFPRRPVVFATNMVSLLCSVAVGLYWIAARFEAGLDGPKNSIPKLEIPLLCLWALAVLIQALLLGAAYALQMAAGAAVVAAALPNNGLPASPSLVEKTPPTSLSNSQSFPDSLPDLYNSPSLHVRHQGSMSSILSIKRKNGAHGSNGSNIVMPGAGDHAQMPSLSGLDAVPEGLTDLDWDMRSLSGQDRIRWILAHADQSRSVSGSSQLTGTFPAADYNRRINEMGFQKDEPMPLPKIRAKPSFSAYDRERQRIAMAENA